MEMNILDVHILLEIEKREEYNYHIFKSSDSEVGNLSSSYRELLVLQHQKKWFTNCRQDLIYFTDSCSSGIRMVTLSQKCQLKSQLDVWKFLLFCLYSKNLQAIQFKT